MTTPPPTVGEQIEVLEKYRAMIEQDLRNVTTGEFEDPATAREIQSFEAAIANLRILGPETRLV